MSNSSGSTGLVGFGKQFQSRCMYAILQYILYMQVYYTTNSTCHLYLAELNEGNEVGLGVGFTGHKGPGSLCVTVKVFSKCLCICLCHFFGQVMSPQKSQVSRIAL